MMKDSNSAIHLHHWSGINANYSATFGLGIALCSLENRYIFQDFQDRPLQIWESVKFTGGAVVKQKILVALL